MKTKNFKQFSDNGFSISVRINTNGTFKSTSEFIFHGDKEKQYKKEYRLQNEELISSGKKEYYIKNKDVVNDKIQQYHNANPNIQRKCSHNQRAKRKQWGTPIILNKYFENSHCHHLQLINSKTGEIDHRTCLYIPIELHKSIWHSNKDRKTMIKINELVFEWLLTQV